MHGDVLDDEVEPDASRWRAWVEEVLDTTGLAPRAAVVGVAVLGVLLGAFWWLSQQAPAPVEAGLPLVDPTSVTTTTTTTAPAPAPVTVHVAGAVRHPGVHQLPPASRVIDAVEACGGLTDDADPDRVNLAAELADGVQVYVPRVGEPVPAGMDAAPGGPDGSDAGGTVDLNRADAALLESLPGIGPVTAAAIVDHRERHGPFVDVDGLLDVRGIGEAKLAVLRDLVRV